MRRQQVRPVRRPLACPPAPPRSLALQASCYAVQTEAPPDRLVGPRPSPSSLKHPALARATACAAIRMRINAMHNQPTPPPPACPRPPRARHKHSMPMADKAASPQQQRGLASRRGHHAAAASAGTPPPSPNKVHAVREGVHLRPLHADLIDPDFGVGHTTVVPRLGVRLALGLAVAPRWACRRTGNQAERTSGAGGELGGRSPQAPRRHTGQPPRSTQACCNP